MLGAMYSLRVWRLQAAGQPSVSRRINDRQASSHGSAAFCFGRLGVPLPSGVAADKRGYLFFTWGTIGFVDHPWLLGCVDEAWVRNPTTRHA